MTILRHQLRALRAQNKVHNLKENIRASILHNPFDAARIDTESIYHSAINGLMALKAKDERFEPFFDTLFSQRSLELDRNLLTMEENTKLNESIREFLLLLSPSGVEKSALLVLEYLVRKYEINRLNVEDFMEAFIYLHESHIISRFIQIIDIKHTIWYFLHGMKKGHSFLHRAIISERCKEDHALREFICRSTFNLVKVHGMHIPKDVIAFFLGSMIEMIDRFEMVDQNVVRFLVTNTINAVKHINIPELQAAGYTILLALSRQVTFTKNMHNAIVHEIHSCPCKDITMTISCLVVFQQTQCSAFFHKSSAKEILFLSNLAETLMEFEATMEINKFVEATLIPITDDILTDKAILEIVLSLFSSLNSITLAVGKVITKLLMICEKDLRVNLKKGREHLEFAAKLLQQCSKRFPKEVDKRLAYFSKRLQPHYAKNTKLAKTITEFFMNTFSGDMVAHRPLQSLETTLTLALENPNPLLRIEAIKQLENSSLDNPEQFASLSIEMIRQRLFDDDVDVVTALLSTECYKYLTKSEHLSKLELFQDLLSVLGKWRDEYFQTLSSKCTYIQYLIMNLIQNEFAEIISEIAQQNLTDDESVSFMMKYFEPFFDYLFYFNDKSKKFTDQMVVGVLKGFALPSIEPFNRICYSNINDSTTQGKGRILTKNEEAQFYNTTLNSIVESCVTHPDKAFSFLNDAIRFFQTSSSLGISLKILSIFIQELNTKSPEIIVQYLPQCLNMLNNTFSRVSKRPICDASALSCANIFEILSNHMNPSDERFIGTVPTQFNENSAILLQLLKNSLEATSFVENCNLSLSIIQFLGSHNVSISAVLASIFVNDTNDISETARLLAINFMISYISAFYKSKYVKQKGEASEKLLYELAIAFPCLIVCGADLNQNIRKAAIAAFTKISSLQFNKNFGNITISCSKNWSPIVSLKNLEITLVEIPPISLSLLQLVSTDLSNHALEIELDAISMQSYLVSLPSLKNENREIFSEYLSASATWFALKFRMFECSSKIISLAGNSYVVRQWKHYHLLLLTLFDQNFDIQINRTIQIKIFRSLLHFFHDVVQISKNDELFNGLLNILEIFSRNPYLSDQEKIEIFNDQRLGKILTSEQRSQLFDKLLDMVDCVDVKISTFIQNTAKVIPVSIIEILNRLLAQRQLFTENLKIKEQHEMEIKGKSVSSFLSSATSLFEILLYKDSYDLDDFELEQKDNQKNIRNHFVAQYFLFQLFKILEIFSNSEIQTATGGEYIIQLIFEVLIKYFRHIIPEKIRLNHSSNNNENAPKTNKRKREDKIADFELYSPSQIPSDISNIIKTTKMLTSEHTRRLVLLLIAQISTKFPKKASRSLSPVISIIGQSALSHSDNYGLNLAIDVIKSIIPALKNAAQSTAQSDDSPVVKIYDIVQVFIESTSNIPSHYRTRVFTSLTKVLSESSLPVITTCLLLQKKDKIDSSYNQARFELIQNSFFEFSPTHQLAALAGIIQIVIKILYQVFNQLHLLDDLDLDESINYDPIFLLNKSSVFMQFDTSAFCTTPELGAKAVYFLSQYLFDHLNSRRFHHQVFSTKPKTGDARTQRAYLLLCEGILSFNRILKPTYLTQNRDWFENHKFIHLALTETSSVSYDTLNLIKTLLSVPSFVAVVSELLHSDDTKTRKNALQMLTERITQDSQDGITEAERTLYIEMIPDLLKTIIAEDNQEEEEDEAINDETRSVVNAQTGLLALDILGRHFATSCPKAFIPVLNYISDKIAKFNDHLPNYCIISSCFLCIATLCAMLGPKCFPKLPLFFPPMLRTFGIVLDQMSNLTSLPASTKLLLNAILSAIISVATNLPQFLHPYLDEIVSLLLNTNLVKCTDSSIVQRSKKVFATLASSIATRFLLPSIIKSYEVAAARNSSCVCRLFECSSELITCMDRDAITHHLSVLSNFFLIVFDYTRNYPDLTSHSSAIDRAICSAFASLVLKLNEKELRPLFARVFEWQKGTDVRDAPLQPFSRKLMFYLLTSKLMDTFKEIFVSFLKQTFDDCQLTLNLANNITRAQLVSNSPIYLQNLRNLLSRIIYSLQKCFEFDKTKSITKKVFDSLSKPLVGLLSNTIIFTDLHEYKTFMCEKVVLCISQLAVVAGKDIYWKTLNYDILMLTRSDISEIRYCALQCINELFINVGEEYLVLLPECLPFFSELMEDTNQEVEQLCRKVVKYIEDLSGESMETYLN